MASISSSSSNSYDSDEFVAPTVPTIDLIVDTLDSNSDAESHMTTRGGEAHDNRAARPMARSDCFRLTRMRHALQNASIQKKLELSPENCASNESATLHCFG